MSAYKIEVLQQLTDQQVRFAPPARCLEQVARAERLLAEVNPDKNYPYQFVCFRITDFRPDTYADLLIPGADLQHDLGLFIASLAESIPAIPAEKVDGGWWMSLGEAKPVAATLPTVTNREPVLTLVEMSKKLNVTTKTLNRWRKRGLIGLPVLFGGRRQVGFLPSLVEPFLSTNRERVERGRRFSQLSFVEKEEIVRRARRLVQVPAGTLTEISRRIARRMGRSVETIRYTLKNFDREHPDQALFPEAVQPLDTEVKQLIFNSYRRGITVETLAKKYHRTRSSVYRVINEARALRLLELPVDYINDPTFEDASLEAVIIGPMPDQEKYETEKRKMRIPKDVPLELASLYEVPLLSKDQERHLFRKMNFLKHKANKIRQRLLTDDGLIDITRLRASELDRFEDYRNEATVLKEQLINCNMRLVVSIAKRHASQAENLFELISDGNISLIRAVEKFDQARGNKFSTYASWAIMKNYARSIPEEKNRRERYVTGNEQVFEAAPDNRTDEQEVVAAAEQATHKVNRLLENLDPRERQIIRLRAGLDNEAGGMTLEKIGEQLGITKERVRQLNVRAMKKLRNLAETQRDDLL